MREDEKWTEESRGVGLGYCWEALRKAVSSVGSCRSSAAPLAHGTAGNGP
jgi:hypothetical protein